MEHIRDINAFNDAISLYDELINRNDLRKIKNIPLLPMHDIAQDSEMRLIKILSISEACSNQLVRRLVPLLGALHHLNAALGYILQVKMTKVNIYLAIKCPGALNTAVSLIQKIFTVKYPDLFVKVLSTKESLRLINQSLFCSEMLGSISSIITSPLICNDFSSSAASRLKQLLLCTENENYTLLFLADYTKHQSIKNKIYQLENLYTLLDSFKETTFTYHRTLSDSCTNNSSITKTSSFTSADTKTASNTTVKGCSSKVSNSLILNAKVDDQFNYIINAQPSKENEAKNNCTASDSATGTKQKNITDLKGDSETTSKGNNTTFCFKGENKTASKLLKTLDLTLNDLYKIENGPVFSFGVYILSPYLSSTLHAAYTYLDIMHHNKEYRTENYITTWDKDNNDFTKILSYLSQLGHPHFSMPRHHAPFTPTHFIDSHHLSHMIGTSTCCLSK